MGKAKFGALISSVIATLMLLHGCAGPSLQIPVTMPAEVNLTGVSTIAVGGIEGEGGQNLYDALETELVNCGRFDVVDRRHLMEIAREKSLSFSGELDPNATAEMSRMLGAAALIFGRVSVYDYAEKVTKGTSTDREGGTHTTYDRVGTFRYEAILQVTDLTTGKILAKAPMLETSQTSTHATDEMPASIDPGDLAYNCRQAVVSRFMKTISPSVVIVQVNFKTSTKTPELRQGINYAKAGDLQEARKVFEKATADHPNDPLALFDYAVACELCGLFDEAIESYKRVYVALPKRFVLDAKSRCEQRKPDTQRPRAHQE